MNFYFALQYKRVKRLLKKSGINHFIALGIVLFLFVAISHFIFEKVIYAQYVYPIISLSLLNILGNVKRNEFLKNCYTVKKYKQIRLLENIVGAIPFVIYLLFKQEYITAILLLVISSLLSLFNKINSFQFVIPTPFYKNPYEFITGFRKTYVLFILSYTLTIISIYVGNFNLGIFALILIVLTCLNFYSKPEPKHLVWIHAQTPKLFINKKIKVAILYSFILILPIILSLSIINIEKAYLLVIFSVFGISTVVVSLLGKYAFYPSEINISQGMLISVSLIFPPITLIIIPILYIRSTQNLTHILHD
ncbi:MAG: ABC transporter permease [Flavobacteriales bacterium]|nr:ABC transporter permease [Flavobacteriales bacterium]MCB9365261.1 ABC transporter permease [Flavobacteriales bacterium]